LKIEPSPFQQLPITAKHRFAVLCVSRQRLSDCYRFVPFPFFFLGKGLDIYSLVKPPFQV
jgi:hypothetical protein